MTELSVEQIRRFRLAAHHLDRVYANADIPVVVGACGMQNSPPGAWETAAKNRVPDISQAELEALLCREKTLLQTWSIRGLPMVFPEAESSVYLSALIPEGDEPWIYTAGIGLALDFLQLRFDELLKVQLEVLPQLDGAVIASKTDLDRTIAGWMRPLLPAAKRELWDQPSMYGSPDKQTVGGAVASFLLRPCAFCGLVVFGGRDGTSPTFTSYRNWVGHPFKPDPGAAAELARRYLHCYGPATADMFADWLGCSGKQARRMLGLIEEELEPVTVEGKKRYILSADREQFFADGPLERELLLLGGHDPYLDQRDRAILQPDKTLQRQIWRYVGNPGVIVQRGKAVGIWNGRKKGSALEMKMTLWESGIDRKALFDLAEEYAAFRQLRLSGVEY